VREVVRSEVWKRSLHGREPSESVENLEYCLHCFGRSTISQKDREKDPLKRKRTTDNHPSSFPRGRSSGSVHTTISYRIASSIRS
jgi:hypothetical protein